MEGKKRKEPATATREQKINIEDAYPPPGQTLNPCIKEFEKRGRDQTLKLYPWQERIAEYFANAEAKRNPLFKNDKGLISQKPYGSGKTLEGLASGFCYLKSHPRSEVLIVPPATLVPNWENEIKRLGLNKKKEAAFFKVFSQQSFPGLQKKGEVDCKDKMLIIDELHNLRTRIKESKIKTDLLGNVFKTKAKGIRAKAMLNCAKEADAVLGLTASPLYNNAQDLSNFMSMLSRTKERPLSDKRIQGMSSGDFQKYTQCKFSTLLPEEQKFLDVKRPTVIFMTNDPDRENKQNLPLNPISEAYFRIHHKENRENLPFFIPMSKTYFDIFEKSAQRLREKHMSLEGKVIKNAAFRAEERQAMNKIENSVPLEKAIPLINRETKKLPIDTSLRARTEYLVKQQRETHPPKRKVAPLSDMTEEELLDELFEYPIWKKWAGQIILQDNEKLKFVLQLIQDNYKTKKIYIFSSFKGRGVYIIADWLQQHHIPFEAVTGDVKDKQKRLDKIEKYNTTTGPHGVNILLGTAAMREGFNLKNTDIAIELEPSWNEASSEQGLFRAIRIDSHPKKGTVIVYRLLHSIPKDWELKSGFEPSGLSADETLRLISQMKKEEIDERLKEIQQVLYETKLCQSLGPDSKEANWYGSKQNPCVIQDPIENCVWPPSPPTLEHIVRHAKVPPFPVPPLLLPSKKPRREEKKQPVEIEALLFNLISGKPNFHFKFIAETNNQLYREVAKTEKILDGTFFLATSRGEILINDSSQNVPVFEHMNLWILPKDAIDTKHVHIVHYTYHGKQGKMTFVSALGQAKNIYTTWKSVQDALQTRLGHDINLRVKLQGKESYAEPPLGKSLQETINLYGQNPTVKIIEPVIVL